LKTLRSIQCLRAIAAIGVLIFHDTKTHFGIGAAGVDLFFVISGFIMAEVSRDRTPAEFLSARLWRVFPLYFVCAAGYFLLVPVKWNACQAVSSATLFPLGCSPYLTPAWTLSYEMVFYTLVALCIGRRHILPLVVALIVLFPALSNRGSNLLLLEFVAGWLISYAPRDRNVGIGISALALIAFALAPWDMGRMGEAPLRFLLWGLPSAALVYGALTMEKHFARAGFLVRLGDASYSIYLVHYILWRVLPMWWPFAVYTQISVGYLVHLFVEKPLLRLRRSRQTGQPTNPAVQASSI
jgi:exopolysaccharide production protein ExoZ